MAQIDTKTELPVWAEYGWIDGGDPRHPGEGPRIRSKGFFLYVESNKLLDLDAYPEWSFDGSSTHQAPVSESEVILRPEKVFRDPMKERRDPSSPVTVLVWCSTWTIHGEPHETNTRHELAQLMKENAAWDEEQDPLIGFEQEYTLVLRGNRMKSIIPEVHPNEEKEETEISPEVRESLPENFYAGYGSYHRWGRKIAEEHARRCAQIGILLWGVNAEVGPGQWEFQTRPNLPMDAADELWVARWILLRTAEDLEFDVRFHPKPFGKAFPGSGCHLNISTKDLRETPGFYETAIEKIRTKFEEDPTACWKAYGAENELRLTGLHETAPLDTFISGVGHRGASIRVPYSTQKKQRGYLEDRRPAANMDPYAGIRWMLSVFV